MKNYMMSTKGAHQGSTDGQSKERKIRHLKGLLAAGEISREEYNRRVRAIS